MLLSFGFFDRVVMIPPLSSRLVAMSFPHQISFKEILVPGISVGTASHPLSKCIFIMQKTPSIPEISLGQEVSNQVEVYQDNGFICRFFELYFSSPILTNGCLKHGKNMIGIISFIITFHSWGRRFCARKLHFPLLIHPQMSSSSPIWIRLPNFVTAILGD